MTKAPELPNKKNDAVKKRTVFHKTVIAIIAVTILAVISGIWALIHNNVSFTSDEVFAAQTDAAIASAEKWVSSNKMDILEKRNIGLLKMLRECDAIKPNPVFEEIVRSFLASRSRPECWKRLIDPNWPVNEMELNQTIKNENTDNKWILYAMAPDKAKITPEEMHLFEPGRWRGRKLAHQLDALTAMRKTKGATKQIDELIEHLSTRVSNELFFDVLKVDIGQVAFVLRAGFPEKIKKRWVERIVASQLPDGGWNNRWCYFVSEKRSVFGFSMPTSNQHDTVLALEVLYLAKYRYPEHFGLK